jgi:hypothetical protein
MICTHCHEDKDASLFSRNKRTKTGYNEWCKDCYKEWQGTNIDRLREYWRGYYRANTDKARINRRAYYLAHRQEAIARAAEWAKNNPSRVRELRSAWKHNNKDAVNHATRTRRTRIRSAETGLTREQWVRLVDTFGGKCAYCGGDCPNPEADHLIPVKMGGGYVWGNVFPICRECNAKKAGTSPVEFLGISKYADLMVSCH